MRIALNNLPMKLFRPLVTRFMTASLAPDPSLLKAGAVLVNREGRRFADELQRPDLEVPRQSRKEAFIVFDDAVAQRYERWPHFVSTAPGVGYAYLADYRRTRPDLYHRADSVAGLARSIGVPPETMVSTIDAHNAVLADPEARKQRSAITQAPFHALGPVQTWVVITEGGLGVSPRHEVLDGEGKPIPGLYAAGSAGQGGVILAGHGHHIGWAFVSGRRAGKFAAEDRNRD
jgi:fumarate reductase flavoprotein subunit